jgi:hypothetical protein
MLGFSRQSFAQVGLSHFYDQGDHWISIVIVVRHRQFFGAHDFRATRENRMRRRAKDREVQEVSRTGRAMPSRIANDRRLVLLVHILARQAADDWLSELDVEPSNKPNNLP